MDQALIDQLDLDLYDMFMELKTQYDRFNSFDSDVNLQQQITEKVGGFLKDFEVKYDSQMNTQFFTVLDSMKKTL